MAIKNYVPILRPKQGELWAIRDLFEDTRKRITPFFDVHRVQIIKGKKDKSLDDHLISIIKRICKDWPSDREFFWDMYSIDPSERLKDRTHPALWFGKNLYNYNMKFIPTVGTDRDGAYLEAIENLLALEKTRTLCVRILRDDLETPSESVREVRKILKRLKLSKSLCHLFIDVKNVADTLIDEVVDNVAEFTSKCNISMWKTFTFSSSAFPVDMSGFALNSQARVPRVEIKLWKALLKAHPLIGRKSKYSDYVILNPEKPDVDPTTMRAGGKIRYATEEEWIIIKGHGLLKGRKYEQYRDLASRMIKLPEYQGHHYSWGDEYIDKCSKRLVGPGSLTTWIRVDTNHHLTLVGEQISNFLSSSNNN